MGINGRKAAEILKTGKQICTTIWGGGIPPFTTLVIIKSVSAKRPKVKRLVKNFTHLEHFRSRMGGGASPHAPGYAPGVV